MGKQRKRHSKEFKARVALEALRGLKTLSELASEHKLHPTQVRQWKAQLQSNASELFERGRSCGATDEEALNVRLYEEIGRLKMEVNFLQKSAEGSA